MQLKVCLAVVNLSCFAPAELGPFLRIIPQGFKLYTFTIEQFRGMSNIHETNSKERSPDVVQQKPWDYKPREREGERMLCWRQTEEEIWGVVENCI
jgi:hypothetical protein